jgi:CHAT domain-containing protein
LADPRVKATQSKLPQLKNQKIATTRSREEATDKDLQRSLNDAVDDLAGLQTISRLPFSRREAEAIAQIVPTKDTFKALDFAASTEKATGGNLADYKIVHFATHGLLNSKNPALSGLILSLVNARGEPQNGFLRLNDIYNLRLNSDLVVLSACQTALGKDIRGEGLIGLTRGFMYAGAARVVASLWKVDDAATAELMKRFYQNMLAKKQRPAEALRAAQIEMSKDERFKSPYFWAAFTLQGEWR